MNTILNVARREISTYLRRPSFYLSLFLTPLIATVILLAFSSFGIDTSVVDGDLLADRPSRPSGYVDQAGVVTRIPDELHPFFIPYATEDEAAAALRADAIPAYFVVAPDYLATGGVTKVSQQLSITGGEGADTRALETLLRANLGGDSNLAERLDAPLALDTEIVGAPQEAPSPTSGGLAGSGASLGVALLLVFAILQGGSWLVQAVAEEKENRTVEVVLTSVQPIQLMAGKLLGLGALTLLQLVGWLVLSGGALAAGVAIGVSVGLGVPPSIWLWSLVYFLLGFAFYGALVMSIGALGGSVRESNQVAPFLMLPLFIPYYFFDIMLDYPDGLLAQVLSYLPFTSPMAMLLRLGVTNVPLWQIGLSIGLLALGALGTVWLAARVFRASTLLTGSKVSLRTLVQAARG